MKSLFTITLSSGQVHYFWFRGTVKDVAQKVEDNFWIGDDTELVRSTEVESIEFSGTEDDLKP
jgi:hypothetical protein